MGESFIFLLFLILALLLQALMGIWHAKYYQKEVSKIHKEFTNGYLGVGMTKKTLNHGKVAIIATDKNGIIRECRIVYGLLVVCRFHKYQEYVSEDIDVIDWKNKKHKKAVQEAIKQIKIQKKRQDVS